MDITRFAMKLFKYTHYWITESPPKILYCLVCFQENCKKKITAYSHHISPKQFAISSGHSDIAFLTTLEFKHHSKQI